ncbi:YiiX/YebB-like N1pC/P60 family cysteine hydrolase [Bradyrhizobium sp. SZCCHNRI20481]|uniref:YiiX/YebB-like N1pC/P60 family cysteine hydrolase n=1 Tax=Bradyrhizobium sp. SZCCHNRI20481 TaxID=3057286 RepID=UPI0029161F27|nr:YiiX/YebB-like N1pC/P60 family cysteine hydrolase [Bradyrhizobium sp. SZCCHNRI20481]
MLARTGRQDERESTQVRRNWIFDPGKLQPGDVVLERGKRLRSKAIALADRGTYSHALLWLGNTDFIEAVGNGVRVISFQRVLVHHPKRWLLIRLVEDPGKAQKAAAVARNLAHKKYDLRGALSTKMGGRKTPDPTSLFCSQLVATAYAEAGYAIAPGKIAAQVTPADIENKSGMTSIPLPLVEVERGRKANRDESYKGTSMEREMQVSQEAFLAVQGHIDTLEDPATDGVNFPPGSLYDFLEVLSRQKRGVGTESEDLLLSELSRLNYFMLSVPTVIGARAEIESARAELLAPDISDAERHQILENLNTVAMSYRDTQQRYQQNGATCQRIYSYRRHQLWLKLAAMHFRNADGMSMLIELTTDTQHHQG